VYQSSYVHVPYTAIWRAWQALATLYSICLIDFSASTSV